MTHTITQLLITLTLLTSTVSATNQFVGNVLYIDGNSGFSCGSMNDAFIDNKLHTACAETYPGSRAVTGDELVAGVLGLPDNPPYAGVPACPGCDGCDNGGGRYCTFSEDTWNDPSTWSINHVGNVLTAVCVVTVEPPTCYLGEHLVGNDCVPCYLENNCQTCDVAGVCLSCFPGHVFLNGGTGCGIPPPQCYPGQYSDGVSCIPCYLDGNCQLCDEPGVCLSCFPGHSFVDGQGSACAYN